DGLGARGERSLGDGEAAVGLLDLEEDELLGGLALEADLGGLGLGLLDLRACLEEREVLPDAEPEADRRADVGVAHERVALLRPPGGVARARRPAEEELRVIVRAGYRDERLARADPGGGLAELGAVAERKR